MQTTETQSQSTPAGQGLDRTPTSVIFAGAGPGAVDLITLRARQALDTADLVIYAGSLVNTALLDSCRKDAKLVDSSRLSLAQQVELMAEAARKGQKVVRLHSGDPTIYGAIREQKVALARLGVDTVIIPGVTSACAAAATLGIELTVPEVSQSIVLSRAQGRTPMPKLQRPAAFAGTGATLIFYLSAAHFNDLTAELMGEGNLPATTPCAVVNRVSWQDERVVRGPLKDIAALARQHAIHRQALLLVGEALNDSLDKTSLLYNEDFSHGYRNTLIDESFEGPVAVLAFSERGRLKAQEICTGLGTQATYVADHTLHALWDRYAGIVCLGATGLVVRLAAPLLKDKARDPALVCVDDRGRFAVSLTGGHLAGANRLARRVARITGGEAVVSTATDGSGLVAFDEAAAREGARVLNTRAILACNRALLEGRRIDFYGPRDVWARYWGSLDHVRCVDSETPGAETDAARYRVTWDAEAPEETLLQTTLRISSRVFVLGTGCHSGVDPNLYRTEALNFLERHRVRPEQLACVASLAAKGREACLRELVQELGVDFAGFPSEVLDSTPGVVTGSTMVSRYMGTTSVCEAAALTAARQRGGQAKLVAPKEKRQYVMTFALARIGHNAPEQEQRAVEEQPRPHESAGQLVIAGLGSGQPDGLTAEVLRAILEADVIAGYTRYVDYVRPLLEREGLSKEIVESGMRSEIPRCQAALEQAARGQKVCLVCSGDPGLLAMAGLVLELRGADARLRAVPVRILPGVSAAFLAGASLGAPLQNGAILLSLSDLLVPEDEVRRNLAAASRSALPVTLYNPAGKRRRQLLSDALELFSEARGPMTWCALVKHAGQPQEETWVGRLKDLPQDRVDMCTVVLIGGERTRYEHGALFEARGYADKYGDSLDMRGESES